mgnify:CR=1 FL=1
MTWEMCGRSSTRATGSMRDAALRVLILRGAGDKAFVAGTDIAQFQSFSDRGRRPEVRGAARTRVLDRLERVTKPTIAQVQGVAAGGGCAIALACDLRVATPESSFGIPIARTLGNCLSGPTYGRLLDLINPGIVKDLLFTGRLMSARRGAGAWGWSTGWSPADELDRTVRTLATEIAANAPLTLRATKELVRRVLAKRRLAAGEDADIVEMCYTSRDFQRRRHGVPGEAEAGVVGS